MVCKKDDNSRVTVGFCQCDSGPGVSQMYIPSVNLSIYQGFHKSLLYVTAVAGMTALEVKHFTRSPWVPC